MNDIKIVNLSCKSCGASIQIPPGLDTFNCAYCGAAMMVQRGEGNVVLKMAEQVGQSIQDSGTKTQDTIRETTQTTQIELKRLQISQEISALNMQLVTLQSEIRGLERLKADKRIKRQLIDLRSQEASLHNRIRTLQATLVPSISMISNQPARHEVARQPERVVLPPEGYAGKERKITNSPNEAWKQRRKLNDYVRDREKKKSCQISKVLFERSTWAYQSL